MSHEDAVHSWMTAISQDGGVGRLDDLHIDRIDHAWKTRELWIAGGLEAFRIATALRDKNKLPAAVALAFSLVAGDKPLGVDFKNTTELQTRFDWSPPSLYLLPPGEKPWTFGAPKGVPPIEITEQSVDSSILGIGLTVRCHLIEFKQADSGEFKRTLFLIS